MKASTKKTASSSEAKSSFIEITLAAYLALLAIFIFLPVKYASAEQVNLTDNGSGEEFLTTLTVVGHGELTWLGFSVYEASLWTRNGKFEDFNSSIPVALAITYQRNIDSADLANRTVEEWERLGIFDDTQRREWGEKLKNIWPDVKPGDNITTLITSENVTRFYHNNRVIAVLDDPAFGTALLSIWLDPDTSEPDLRDKLLGKRNREI